MSLDDKRILLESIWVTGKQVEELLASVGYVYCMYYVPECYTEVSIKIGHFTS